MLIVIDVMGTGDVIIDTTIDEKKKKDAKKQQRPQLHELPQEQLQIIQIEQSNQR